MLDLNGYRIGNIGSTAVESVLTSWPAQDWLGWHRYSGERGDKLVSKPGVDLPEAVYRALWDMVGLILTDSVSPSFVDLGLHAAGLHWILPGGCLPRHLDAEVHPTKPWVRTHSIVCFLDSIEKGGELVLGDGRQTIKPVRGEVVMFETENNWHWVNQTDQDRRTIALFAWRASDINQKDRRSRALFSPKA